MDKYIYNFNNKKSDKSLIITLIIMVIIIMFIINPQKYSKSVLNGITLFALNVLPSLLPFFFLTKLLTSLVNIDLLTHFLRRPLKKVFKLPPQFAYIMFISMISGYPIGANLVGELCARDKDKNRVTRLAAVSSTSGIIFVTGTIGGAMLGNKNAALLLYAAHISAALLFAFISGLFVKNKNIYYGNGNFNNNFSDNALSQSVYSAVVSVLSVGVLIAVFYMLTDMLSALPLLEGFFGNLFGYCGI
ncbi:MAG: hypothetical protein PHE12_04515, partial [Clostridia bacterium]|nr:hypothetical protein [Clostridia bacterium]